MPVTKKDFESIANILAESRSKKQVQNRLETYFKTENPNFDVDRFRESIHRKKVRKVI